MLRKLTRYVSAASGSSEDDRSRLKEQVRMPMSNVQVRHFESPRCTIAEGNSIAKKGKNTSNNFAPYLTRLRSRIPPSSSNSDKSSTSETDDFVQLTRRKSLRVSSDYDTGPRSDEVNDANPERILNSLSLESSSVKNNAAFEYSSDDSSVIQTRSLKRRKTSLANLASSTDSSDSGVLSQMGRGLGKRTRLCTSSESSTSTDNSSSEHSDGNNVNASESIMEHESIYNLPGASSEHNRGTPIGERVRRMQRREATRPNRIRRQSRPSSSRPVSMTVTSENSTPRSARPRRRRPSHNENGVRPNTIQVQTNRSATTSASTSQNQVSNTGRQTNRRPGARAQNNVAVSIPAHSQNVRCTPVDSHNPFSESSSNRPHTNWPFITISRQNNTRSVVNRQNSIRPPVTRARQNNRRTSTNGENRGRTTISITNPTSATRRQNATVIRPTNISGPDPETNFRLRISTESGQTYFSNPLHVSGGRTDIGSSSDSSSDDVRPVPRRRRVIFSSDNNATSSDSEASFIFMNRSRRRANLIISDNESAEETRTMSVATSETVRQTVLSDSDGETEKCPICFGKFSEQEVGTPKTCEHCFCLECIKKWAENNNTCPVDRRTFNSIIVRASVHGGVIREDAIPPPNNMALMHSDDDSFYNSFSDSNSDTTDDLFFLGSDFDYDIVDDFDIDTFNYDGPDEVCCVCMLGSEAEEMLYCDNCDNIYHLQCATPPLEAIPTYWICPECSQEAIVDVVN